VTFVDVLCDPSGMAAPRLLGVTEGKGRDVCSYHARVTSGLACVAAAPGGPALPPAATAPGVPQQHGSAHEPAAAPAGGAAASAGALSVVDPAPLPELTDGTVVLHVGPGLMGVTAGGVVFRGLASAGCGAQAAAAGHGAEQGQPWAPAADCHCAGGGVVAVVVEAPQGTELVGAWVGPRPCDAAGLSGRRGSAIAAGNDKAAAARRAMATTVPHLPSGSVWCLLPRGFGTDLPATFVLAPPGASPALVRLEVPRAVSYELAFDPLRFDPVERLGVGGLGPQILGLFRRLFATRVVPAAVLEATGATHARGALLHGPPGTGKTLLARALARFLGARVRFVAGPEVMSKFVGDSEARVRALFEPAERERRERGDAASLHVLIIDEVDSLLSRRSGSGSEDNPAQRVYDGVVDQFLAKMDGAAETTPNLLVIGLTNRKAVLDPAVLRPGRLEVHVEVPYPSRRGREEILGLHTRQLRERGMLDTGVDLSAVGEATDGMSGADLAGLARDAAALAMQRAFGGDGGGSLGGASGHLRVTVADVDEALATARRAVDERRGRQDEATEGLSPDAARRLLQPYGLVAEAEPLVAALRRAIRAVALQAGIPAPAPLLGTRAERDAVVASARRLREAGTAAAAPPPPAPRRGGALPASEPARTATLLLHGPEGAGKTALAAEVAAAIAAASGWRCPLGGAPAQEDVIRLAAAAVRAAGGGDGDECEGPDDREGGSAPSAVRILRPSALLELHEGARARAVRSAFGAARRACAGPGCVSVLLLDDLEGLLEAVRDAGSGAAQASRAVAHTLSVVLRDGAGDGAGRLVVVATARSPTLLASLGLLDAFRSRVAVPRLSGPLARAALGAMGVAVEGEGADWVPLGGDVAVRDVSDLASTLRRLPLRAGGAEDAPRASARSHPTPSGVVLPGPWSEDTAPRVVVDRVTTTVRASVAATVAAALGVGGHRPGPTGQDEAAIAEANGVRVVDVFALD